MLILVSGPSGVGKNTVIDELRKRHKNLEIMKTCTTRKDRAQNDQTYIRTTPEQFKKMIENGELFEYENVHADIFYGTPHASLEKVLKGEKDFIKDIDVHGVEKLAKHMRDKTRVVTIFLDSDDAELERRLVKRGEERAMIEKRIARAKMERTYKDGYDIVLQNDDVQKTADQIEKRIGKASFK